MKIKEFVDPPQGWRYGFPKELPPNVTADDMWFLENGYPQELIDNGMLQWVRHFKVEE